MLVRSEHLRSAGCRGMSYSAKECLAEDKVFFPPPGMVIPLIIIYFISYNEKHS